MTDAEGLTYQCRHLSNAKDPNTAGPPEQREPFRPKTAGSIGAASSAGILRCAQNDSYQEVTRTRPHWLIGFLTGAAWPGAALVESGSQAAAAVEEQQVSAAAGCCRLPGVSYLPAAVEACW